MQWFYSDGSGQIGPVTDEELQSLIARGEIRGETLVWNTAMPDWVPLATTGLASVSEPPVKAAPLGAYASSQGVCVECGCTMPAHLLVQVAGNHVCVSCKDRAIDKLRMRVPLGGIAWRDGKNMVVADGAQLPDQCIKCNLPAGGGRIKRKIYWHPPLVYLVILFNLLIYAIVALCVR